MNRPKIRTINVEIPIYDKQEKYLRHENVIVVYRLTGTKPVPVVSVVSGRDPIMHRIGSKSMEIIQSFLQKEVKRGMLEDLQFNIAGAV